MFTLLSSALLVPAMLSAQPTTELESLRQRCTQQQNHITILETRIKQLESVLAKDPKLKAEVQGKSAPPSLKGKSNPAGSYTVVPGDTLASIARKHGTTVPELSTLNKINDPRRLAIGQSLVLASSSNQAPALKAPKAVPVKEPVAPTSKTSHPKKSANYTIKSGDTFYGISRKNKLKLSVLEADNPNISASALRVGQRIHVRNYQASKEVAKKTPSTLKKSAPKPVKKSAPKPAPRKSSKPKAAPKPSVAKKSAPLPEPKFEAKTEAIRSVKVSSDITFGALAANHGVTTTQLNELNGLNLTKSTLLAKGSELYVPTR